MKKLNLVLIICIMLVCCPWVSRAAGNKYAVIGAAESVVNKSFKKDKDVYKAADNICLNVIQSDDPQTEYLQPAFFKYDISEYANRDIKSAAFIWKSSAHKPYTVYDVPGNDLTLTYTDGTPDRIAAGDLITSRTYQKDSPPLTDYPEVPEDYNIALDVTSYVKNKAGEGQTSFSVMFYAGWGGSVVFTPSSALLWIEYDANEKPRISIESPSGDNAVPNESMTVSARITDDGTVEKVKFIFDNKEYKYTKSGDVYSISVSATVMNEGEHTVTISAGDNDGAVTTVTKKIYVRSFRISGTRAEYENGGAVEARNLRAGEYICAKTEVTGLANGSMPVTLVFALYNNKNMMKALGISTVTVNGTDKKEIRAKLQVPNDIDFSTAELRICVTNGESSILAEIP